MLRCFSYGDEIVLFWDKTVKGASLYEIFLNGKKIGETAKTFFRIKDLEPETEYGVSVGVRGRGEKTDIVSETKCRTAKVKKDIVVTDFPYRAVGDGKTLNTAAIQRAIDDCGKDFRVVIPKGVFKTGALRLHDDVELYVEKCGVLKGSEKKEDYLPKIPSRFEGKETLCYSSLINLGHLDRSGKISVKNVIIRGKGKIIGGGEELLFDTIGIAGGNLREKRRKLKAYQNDLFSDKEEKFRSRGRLINISNAKGVIIDGLELGNAPCWNIHMIYSANVVTCGCKIFSKGIWNGDGWDPDSSKDCTLFDCEFDTGDDCVAIKSGKNPEGNIIDKPAKNIDIFSCRVKKGKSHGVAIGSEVSGGVKGVRIWDCDFSCSFFGVHIKTTRKRGGYVKDVEVRDSKISRVFVRQVDYNDDGAAAKELTEISDITFDNVDIEYNSGDPNFGLEADTYIYVRGFEDATDKVKDITFRYIRINNKEKLREYDVDDCENVTYNGKRIK